MKYKLLYTRSAAKDVNKLDAVAKRKIKKKIEYYSKDPILHAVRLTNSVLGQYRWRVGNYRVVFDIKRNEEIIILRVGHRKEIYK